MGLYTRVDQVRSRLLGKVRFTDDPHDENKISEALLNTLIAQAEGDVELDLSPRYAAPFQTDAGGAFNTLPMHPTRLLIQTICELLSCIRILETDFGRSGAENSEKYTKAIQTRYDEMVKRLLKRRKIGGDETGQWIYPPLPGLMLNYQNAAADDGFMGQVHITSSGHGGFAAHQVNSPGENFWNGEIEFAGGRDDDGDVL